MSALHRLNTEQLQFAEVFLRCRGNIKEVERELKISYPTVRSRLDQVIEAMGTTDSNGDVPHIYPVTSRSTALDDIEHILNQLERGTLSPSEAIQQLKEESRDE